MHEQTGRLNWGTTRRRKCPEDEFIIRRVATSGSDEAIVSIDLAGHYNRSGSQGPLDESVWGWGAADMSARTTGFPRAHWRRV